MGTENHNVVSFNANTLAKGGHGVIVAIYCTKEAAGAKLEVINGLLVTDPVEFTFRRWYFPKSNCCC